MSDALITPVEPTEDDPIVVNPLNGKEMTKLQVGDIRFDRCPETGAIWLDRGELARISLLDAKQRRALADLDQIESGAETRSRRGPLKSPRTGAVMMVVNDPQQKHIEFEVCPECGGCFFDGGELSDLLDYSFSERLRSFFG